MFKSREENRDLRKRLTDIYKEVEELRKENYRLGENLEQG